MESVSPTVAIPPAAELSATVAAQQTTLYRDGIAVQVPSAEVEHFLNLGFLRHAPADLPALAAEVAAYAGELGAAAERFATATVAAGVIDPAADRELHALGKALALVNERCQVLVSTATEALPTLQGAGVADPADFSDHANAAREAAGEPRLEPPTEVPS
jgi:hypothetical protein